jgi:hypothetical protein
LERKGKRDKKRKRRQETEKQTRKQARHKNQELQFPEAELGTSKNKGDGFFLAAQEKGKRLCVAGSTGLQHQGKKEGDDCVLPAAQVSSASKKRSLLHPVPLTPEASAAAPG